MRLRISFIGSAFSFGGRKKQKKDKEASSSSATSSSSTSSSSQVGRSGLSRLFAKKKVATKHNDSVIWRPPSLDTSSSSLSPAEPPTPASHYYPPPTPSSATSPSTFRPPIITYPVSPTLHPIIPGGTDSTKPLVKPPRPTRKPPAPARPTRSKILVEMNRAAIRDKALVSSTPQASSGVGRGKNNGTTIPTASGPNIARTKVTQNSDSPATSTSLVKSSTFAPTTTSSGKPLAARPSRAVPTPGGAPDRKPPVPPKPGRTSTTLQVTTSAVRTSPDPSPQGTQVAKPLSPSALKPGSTNIAALALASPRHRPPSVPTAATETKQPFTNLKRQFEQIQPQPAGPPATKPRPSTTTRTEEQDSSKEIGRAVQQECRDRSRMPSSA
eukprot:TRINITY_DN18650_c0_g1_i3.p1 TRINITY_DN18650_c0_g1~~TRINITY_DN18650_c0_g1_i3.p1  ORF type:complete len:384 (-),score=6.95 TRINITY_DN18650_c0_g1_i3:15-1166(-)